MNAIQIQILSGPTSGRTGAFVDSPIGFGRANTQQIVIDSPHASREHGELVYHQDAWCVVNISPNGTTVNGKAIGDEPRVLNNGDVIGVGRERLFSVALEQPTIEGGGGEVVDRGAEVDAEERARKRKSLMWVGLAVWFVGVFVLLAVLQQCSGGAKQETQLRDVAALKRTQFEAMVKEKIEGLAVLQNKHEAALAEAERAYEQRDYLTTALYEANVNYKKALGYAGLERFDDGLVQKRFEQCQSELVDVLIERYQTAYSQRKAGQHKAARRSIIELQNMYPDYDSVLHQNLRAQLKLIPR